MFLDRERWVEDRARVQNYGDSPPECKRKSVCSVDKAVNAGLGLGRRRAKFAGLKCLG
jgi:hypothetical protein